MTGKLIDADRLKEVFRRNVANGDAFNQLIDIQPTVDAVPVIRCRHCKYCDCDTVYGVIIPGTEFCTLTRDECISADDFCSRGECRWD